MEMFMKLMAIPLSIVLFFVIFKILFTGFVPDRIFIVSTCVCTIFYATSFTFKNRK